jgi:hypothetical protein
MADEIPGGYYHELDQKGEVVRAHNAKGEEVEILSDADLEQHIKDGTPAALKGAASEDETALAEQRTAVTKAKGKKK